MTSARLDGVDLAVGTNLRRPDALLPSNPYWWSKRVCVVADAHDWADASVQLCERLGARPEILGWDDAEALRGPVGAILLQMGRPGEERQLELLRSWSVRCWQPLCVVSCAPVRGMARVEAFLDGLGYVNLFHDRRGHDYWDDLRRSVDRVLDRHAWVVARVADSLDAREPIVVRALASLVLADDPIVTVRRWAGRQGMDYREFEALTVDHGLPNPKRLLDSVRMALAVVYACLDDHASREQLARRLHYSSGDYLGRQAKRLSGLPFGTLVERGVGGTIDTLLPSSASDPSAN